MPTSPEALHQATLKAFDEEGVAHVPAFLERDLLEAVRAEVDELLVRLQSQLPPSELEPGPPGVGRVDAGGERFIIRVDGLVEFNLLPSVLTLIGCPAFNALAKTLADDAVITQVDLVVRHQGDGHVIAWHQDAVFNRTHRYAALGLALEDTGEGDGDLLTLPGSQQALQDLCALEDLHGFAPPGLRRVAPKSGDLVVHDVMLVHASLALVELPRRRTLYLYVDSAARILDSEPKSSAWVEWRQGLWASAHQAWEAFHSAQPGWRESTWPARFQAPPRLKPLTLAGNYCVRQGGATLGNTAQLFAQRS